MQADKLFAHDGDTLEGLIWREARLGPASLPAVFAANPRLCERLTLDAGDLIRLPAAVLGTPSATPTLPRVNLWD